jgi:hypothetical protein
MAGLAVLVLSACGSSSAGGGGGESSSSSSSSSQAGSNDPCRFVTKDEAAAIFGEAVTTKVNPAGACEYSSSSGKKVLVAVPTVGNAKQFYTFAHVSGAIDVSGLGDRAFCTPAGGAQSTALWVQKGNLVVNVLLESCATEQMFAAKALTRL